MGFFQFFGGDTVAVCIVVQRLVRGCGWGGRQFPKVPALPAELESPCISWGFLGQSLGSVVFLRHVVGEKNGRKSIWTGLCALNESYTVHGLQQKKNAIWRLLKLYARTIYIYLGNQKITSVKKNWEKEKQLWGGGEEAEGGETVFWWPVWGAEEEAGLSVAAAVQSELMSNMICAGKKGVKSYGCSGGRAGLGVLIWTRWSRESRLLQSVKSFDGDGSCILRNGVFSCCLLLCFTVTVASEAMWCALAF